MKELEYPFDSQQLLNKKKRFKRELLEQQKEYVEKRIAILSGSTIGETQGILELFLLNHGIKPTFYLGDYNRYYEEGTFENPQLKKFSPDFIYLHVTNKNVLEIIDTDIKQNNHQLPSAEVVFHHFQEVIKSVSIRYHCPVITNNFEAIPYRILGNADVWHPLGELNLINEVNQLLYQYTRNTEGIYINDLNYEAAFYGLERWFDNSLWYLYKYPYAMDAIPLVCFNIANIIKAILGKNQKVIAVDLDNTLWGGIIGDEGAENIALGTETPQGMAFLDFQKYLKKIGNKGIALTVCSKNEDNIARTGLLHASSVLNAEDFVTIKANWNPKSENLEDIAREINVMQDSLVFLDDNPAEREQVGTMLPDVKIPEILRVEEYRDVLDRAGYFETVKLNQDDLHRTEYYKQNTIRRDEEQKYKDYGDYLDALDMTAIFEKIADNNLARVTQLINKTNQFNMTTKRFTQEELVDFLEKKERFGLCGRLSDKYGDNGIVTVLLGEREGNIFRIINWIMSCRVFKRELEYALFDELIRYCRLHQLDTITGIYTHTLKNKSVEDFYSSLGFISINKGENSETWVYNIPTEIHIMNHHIKFRSEGF